MNWHRIRRWLIVMVAILMFSFVGVSWLVFGGLVESANRVVGPPPEDMPVESLTIPSASGSLLGAWYIAARDARATVILFHPIRGNRRSMLGRAKLLHQIGYSILMVDLQAHGESGGEHITAGYLERHDVSAAVDLVRNRNPSHKIGVVGWSLGGAASLLASPLEIDVLVLESVYPTISDAVHDRVSIRLGPLHHLFAPVLLVQLEPRLGISPSQLRPIDNIANVGCPVLVASGELDLHTTLAETERLFDAATEPKQLVIFPSATHTDLLIHDREKYRNDVVGFLDQYLQQPPMDNRLEE